MTEETAMKIKRVAKCVHCERPITLVDRPWGFQWLHADDLNTGLCSPLVLADKLTHAEPA